LKQQCPPVVRWPTRRERRIGWYPKEGIGINMGQPETRREFCTNRARARTGGSEDVYPSHGPPHAPTNVRITHVTL
jgi:hypothetical protein